MINDSILLNPNESSSSTVSLRSLQEILQNRVIQKKAEMHRTKNTGDITDRVCTEIETLQWVLAQILMLLQRSSAGKK
jgi:Asp/Glu/hydantoin racemase